MAKYKSGVQILIDPEEVVTGKNSRWDGLDAQRVEEYAISFEHHGQQVAVKARNLPNDKLGLIYGFHRHAAALLYNERNPTKPMKLKVVVTSCNDEEALQYAVIENKHRRETNAMDDAMNQRRFREDFGWSNQRIADLYQCSPSYVGQIERLLSLSPAIQQDIVSRRISVKAALDLAELSIEDQMEVIDQVKQHAESLPSIFDGIDDASAGADNLQQSERRTTTKLGSVVAEKVRDRKIEAGGAKGRTLSEVRRLFEQIGEQTENDRVKDLVSLIGKVIRGSLKTGGIQKKLEAMFE